MPALVTGGQTDETAACMRVGMRRAFTSQIGSKQQALASRRYRRRFRIDFGIGIDTAAHRQFVAQIFDKPLQRSGSRQRDSHHVPLAMHGMTERVQSP